MANYLKPQSPLQHKDGDYFYPLTTVDQIITDNDTRLNAELISIDLKDSVESDKIVLGTQAIPISIQEGGTNANNAAEARENLGITPENIGAISMELLWENASPASQFAKQTVSLDLSKYDMVEISFNLQTGVLAISHQLQCKVDGGRVIAATPGTQKYHRRSANVSKTGINFGDCSAYTYSSTVETTTTNGTLIPVFVYGIKGVTV